MHGCIECQLLGKTCDACALERERAAEFRDAKYKRPLLMRDDRDWVTGEETE